LTPSLAKEGVRSSQRGQTRTSCCRNFSAGWSPSSVPNTFRLCRGTSRVPASARQSQNVPVSYPRSVGISPLQATQRANLQGFSSSPLTDSNRRPPPYHGSLDVSCRTRAITHDTVSPGNLSLLRDRDASRDVARVVSDVSVLCPRLVADAGNAEASAPRRGYASETALKRRLVTHPRESPYRSGAAPKARICTCT
jgi:hypothetical protein